MKPTKEYNGRSRIRMFNMCCESYMNACKENRYELAIVDPPYGIDLTNQSQGKGGGVAKKNDYHVTDWDKNAPDKDYFDLLVDKSENQILWGANHYISKIPYDSSCWVVWDKENGATDFSDCELAWTSFSTAVRKYRFKWAGMLQGNMKRKEHRIHPTQKPVQLYKWILTNYAKEGDTILDTHGGSMSIAIACWDLGFDLDVCELDTDYFNDSVKRFEQHISQAQLF